MITTPPKYSDLEITLIGTGGGYGESIVLKFGSDSWAIIDSCINPESKTPLALEYLLKIGANLDNVRFILCTHWHNDHIKGLSKLLELCPYAELCFSTVTDLKQFLLLLELDAAKSRKGSLSATDELSACLDILVTRENPYYKEVQADTLIDKIHENNIFFEIWALSPSPKTCSDFKSELSTLITEYGERTSPIVNKKPNDKSVAVLVRFGDRFALLGSDLEVGNTEFEGWKYILKSSKVFGSNKANFYKLPHHGSENGYLQDIFNSLLCQDSILKTTPFRMHRIPSDKMLEVYSKHSSNLFLTSEINESNKPKRRDKSLEKFINRSVRSISEIKFTYGLIRSRINYLDKDSEWETELFGNAIKV